MKLEDLIVVQATDLRSDLIQSLMEFVQKNFPDVSVDLESFSINVEDQEWLDSMISQDALNFLMDLMSEEAPEGYDFSQNDQGQWGFFQCDESDE